LQREKDKLGGPDPLKSWIFEGCGDEGEGGRVKKGLKKLIDGNVLLMKRT